MATQRTTSNKRDRERAKQLKATAKRARRAEKAEETDAAPSIDDDDGVTDEQLLGQLQELHDAYDNERITFEAFDKEKTRLLDRLAKRI